MSEIACRDDIANCNLGCSLCFEDFSFQITSLRFINGQSVSEMRRCSYIASFTIPNDNSLESGDGIITTSPSFIPL